MKKKIFLVLLAAIAALCLVFGLSACDKVDSDDDKKQPDTTQTPGGSQGETPGGSQSETPGGSQSETPGGSQSEATGTQGLKFTAVEQAGNTVGYSVSVGTASDNDIIIPESYLGKPVTRIDDRAFRNCTSITSVTIPKDVTSIGEYAFYNCTSLTSVTIPDSVTSIGQGAFYKCGNLALVNFGADSKLESFGDFAFCECSALVSLTVPKDVTALSEQLFQDCKNLESVNFAAGSKLESISGYAFSGCFSLEEAIIPSGVTNIGHSAYDDCYALKGVYIEDIADWCNIEIDTYFESTPLNYANNLYIDGKLEKSVAVPDGTTKINPLTFKGCTSLESITIPDSVTEIGMDAFYNCHADIIWAGTPKIREIGEDAFDAYQGSRITIPESVTTIAANAFRGCREITSVTIPRGVTSIGKNAFSGCLKLVEVTNLSSVSVTPLGNTSLRQYAKHYSTEEEQSKLKVSGNYIFYEDANNVYLVKYTGHEAKPELPYKFNGKNYEIFQYAFAYNMDIESVNIPDCVTKIGVSAFQGCERLNCVTIPSDFRSDNIGSEAFSLDYRLVEVHNLSTKLNLKKGSLDNGRIAQYAINICNDSADTGKIKTTADGQFTYYEDVETVYLIGYNGNKSTVELPEKLNGKNYTIFRAFYNLTKITSVSVPKGVQAIGEFSFYNCDALKKVNIPSTVTKIGDYAFSGCNSLYEISIPQGVASIGAHAFEYTNLSQINIPDSVTQIGELAFSRCYELTQAYMGSGLSKISANTFELCKELKTLEISPQNSQLACVGAIVYNKAKTQIYMVLSSIAGKVEIAEGVTAIANETFSGCKNITEIILPAGLKTIGDKAFGSCDGLTKVTIPDSVVSIGDYAFYNCANLENVILGESLTKMGESVFTFCKKLASVTFKNTVGWKASLNKDMSGAEEMNVSNPTQNAENLSGDYDVYWQRT